jgi:hypothetical protein
MRRRVALLRKDVPNERVTSIIRLFLLSAVQLIVTVNVGPSSLILLTMMMNVTRFSETSVPTTATRRHIPEDGNLHGHHRDNLKPYRALMG